MFPVVINFSIKEVLLRLEKNPLSESGKKAHLMFMEVKSIKNIKIMTKFIFLIFIYVFNAKT